MQRLPLPLAAQGQRGITIKLQPLEIAVLAHIGGKRYSRINDIIRDLLRMALAPRVAEMAANRRLMSDNARKRVDRKLQRQIAERTAKRANAYTAAARTIVSDEPLVKLVTNVPVSDRDAFCQLALGKGTTASALLREMIKTSLSGNL